MKRRIKIDSSILSAIIILTGFLYFFPQFYPMNLGLDNLLDFFGAIAIIKGTMLRMSARGHKKFHSDKGESLVTTGPYSLIRNPMYLGSFLIGVGFVLIVWPWWTLPIFAWLFYRRFIKQIVIEEAHLLKLFGKEFEDYCKKVPRIFPRVKDCLKIKVRNIFNLKESFSTKEKFGLAGWPILALTLETFQEFIVYGYTDMAVTLLIFGGALGALALGFSIEYLSCHSRVRRRRIRLRRKSGNPG